MNPAAAFTITRRNQTILAIVKMATFTVSMVTLTSTTTLAQGQGVKSSHCCWHQEGEKGKIARANYTPAVIVLSLTTFTTPTISTVILTSRTTSTQGREFEFELLLSVPGGRRWHKAEQIKPL